MLEGAFVISEDGQPPKCRWPKVPLSDDEVKELIKTIAVRVVKYLKRQGHFQDDSASLANDEADRGDELLPELQAASIQSKIASKWFYVRFIQSRRSIFLQSRAVASESGNIPRVKELKVQTSYEGLLDHAAVFTTEILDWLAGCGVAQLVRYKPAHG